MVELLTIRQFSFFFIKSWSFWNCYVVCCDQIINFIGDLSFFRQQAVLLSYTVEGLANDRTANFIWDYPFLKKGTFFQVKLILKIELTIWNVSFFKSKKVLSGCFEVWSSCEFLMGFVVFFFFNYQLAAKSLFWEFFFFL